MRNGFLHNMNYLIYVLSININKLLVGSTISGPVFNLCCIAQACMYVC